MRNTDTQQKSLQINTVRNEGGMGGCEGQRGDIATGVRENRGENGGGRETRVLSLLFLPIFFFLSQCPMVRCVRGKQRR